ncbi:unnamed protein product [Brassica oleracea]
MSQVLLLVTDLIRKFIDNDIKNVLCTLLNIGLCSNSSRLKFQVLCCVATKPAVESVQCFGRK